MKFTYYMIDYKGKIHPRCVTATTDAEGLAFIRLWDLQHINWEFRC